MCALLAHVVTSSTLPFSPLKKHHLALAYHYTREAMASGAIDFQFLPGDITPADILSKHWGYQQIWPMLQATMFWMGDTANLLVDKSSHLRIQEGSDKCLVTKGDSETQVGTGHETKP